VGAVLGSLLFGISGCKTGATAPSNWFTWGKQPSQSALASTAPKKPSTSLPSPHAAVGGQTGLASKSYPNYGNQGYPASPGGTATNSYNTGPYGMASHSSSPATQPNASPYGQTNTGGSQLASHSNTPYAGGNSPYGGTQTAQPATYPAGDNGYRTADTRSSVAASAYEQAANAANSQLAQATQANGYGQPAARQPWETQASATAPTGGASNSAGLSTSTGPYQPGSTGNAGTLPASKGTTNVQQTAPGSYPGASAPAGQASAGAGGYPAAGNGYPAANTNPQSGTYPQSGSGSYPGAGQGYASPYAQ